MTKQTPEEISKKFFSNNSLPTKPNLDDISRIFIIAAKQYLNKDICSYDFSAISEALYDNFINNTKYLITDLGSVLESAAEIKLF